MTLPDHPTDAFGAHIAELVAEHITPAINKVVALIDDGKLSYSVRRLAELTDISKTELYNAINRGDLTPSYPTKHAVVLRDEAIRWLLSLPNEEPRS